MTLQRTHILLEPSQQKLLAEIARLEGRSASDLARELIQQGLDQRQRQFLQEQEHRLAALEEARRVRRLIHAQYGEALSGLDLTDLIHQMRKERTDGFIQRGD